MKSRLLSRLDAAIVEVQSHPLKADVLRAERACLLARQGQIKEARAAHSALQQQYATRGIPSITAWLCLAEGLIHYYHDLGRDAIDRMRRAHALSAAARDMRLHSLSAAWLAHMAYVSQDLPALERNLTDAFQCADADNHGARARACLVVAVTYHYGGRFDLAQTWYAKSRHHATSEGDEAMLSAIMHNMASLQANEARQAAFTQSRDLPQARRALLGAESTGNFDAMVGTGSLDALVPLVRAHVYALQDRWAEAINLYEANYQKGLGQGLDRMQSFMSADMAWCRLQLGQVAEATQQADAAAAAVGADLDVDDRASAHSRLAQIYTQLNRPADAERHQAQAGIDWQTHAGEQAAAVELMGKVLAKLPT